jgi:hypothetical protein
MLEEIHLCPISIVNVLLRLFYDFFLLLKGICKDVKLFQELILTELVILEETVQSQQTIALFPSKNTFS